MKNKIKDILIWCWSRLSGWVLAQIALMWEEYLKDKLKSELDNIIHSIVEKVKEYRGSLEYIKKRDEAYDKVFEAINLPVIFKPFKGIVKTILKDSITKKVDDLLTQLDKII